MLLRLRRRPPEPTPGSGVPNDKPYLVTIHAPGDQYQTVAMGPGDGVGVGGIRVSILADGTIDVWPIDADPLMQVALRPVLDSRGPH